MLIFPFLVGCQVNIISLNTDVEKQSYAIGQQLGKNLKNQNVEIAMDAMIKGIRDGHEGKAELSPDDLAQAGIAFQRRILESNRNSSRENLEKSQSFIKEKSKQMKSSRTGILYSYVKENVRGKKVNENSTVLVEYTGTLLDNRTFAVASSPVQLKVKDLFSGWKESMLLLREGEEMTFIIPPQLGFGDTARENVPPNSALIFNIKLIKIMNKE